MPFISKIGGGSARRFGLSRRSTFFTCNTHTAVVTLNNTDRKCYYPASYPAATTTHPGSFTGWSCSGAATCGTTCLWHPTAGCSCNGWCTCDCTQGCGGATGYCGGSGDCYCIDRPAGSWSASANYSATTYSHSCPTNSGIATTSAASNQSSGTCVYPATYNATENG